MDHAYLAPSPFNDDGDINLDPSPQLSWLQSAVSDGRAYLRLQPAYPYIQIGLDMINAIWAKTNPSLSDINLELTYRNLKELVAAQTNIRIIPAFKTEIAEFDHQKKILNDCFMSWQQMTFADRKIRKAWQYAVATGTGYIGQRYDPSYYYKGKGDIVLDAYGPLDVLPLGLPRSHDLQKAYACTIRVETPIHEAWRLFPLFRDSILASREGSKGRGNVVARAVKFASAVLRRFGPGSALENEPAPWQTVDIYYSYIDDDTVNRTGHDIPMGKPGTSWFYVVPYVGKRIQIGTAQDGSPIWREATEQDCLLYPNKRLMIGTDDVILNPDPTGQVSPYWHGKYPVAQMRSDDWACNFLGFSQCRAGASIEKANNDLMRSAVDSANCRLSPPRAYDRNTMSPALAEGLNTRVPNQVIGLDMTFAGGEQLKPLLPYQNYDIPAVIPALIERNEGRITQQMGVADASALARARQLPAGDSIDKIMESLGPLIRDQSRNMEETIRFIGELWKSNFMQFITARRRMEMIGPDGITPEDFDYDPGTLIPDFTTISAASKTADKPAPIPGFTEYFQRARWHSGIFSFSVVPYSLHELNSITRKLFHLQLMRAGFPVDWWTLADLFDIKNFGPIPKYEDPDTGEMKPADTVMQRYLVQLEIQQRVAAAAGGGPKQKGGGRPPTGNQPPVLEQKKTDGGTRSTIRESAR